MTINQEPEPLKAPEPIRDEHRSEAFDCGQDALNSFLQRFALANHRQGAGRTYVACRGLQVVAYYSLGTAFVERELVPNRVAHGLARHPVPLLLLARLAVDRHNQGFGLGRALLKDAMRRYLQVQEIAGCRALFTQAKDEAAASFYRNIGFVEAPMSPSHFYLLTKDIIRNLAQA